jgi:hypothetical protein
MFVDAHAEVGYPFIQYLMHTRNQRNRDLGFVMSELVQGGSLNSYTMPPYYPCQPVVPAGSTVRQRVCMGPRAGAAQTRLCVYLLPPPAMEPVVMFWTGRCWAVDRTWDSYLHRINYWQGLSEEERAALRRHTRSDCEATVLTYEMVSELREYAQFRRNEVIEIDD